MLYFFVFLIFRYDYCSHIYFSGLKILEERLQTIQDFSILYQVYLDFLHSGGKLSRTRNRVSHMMGNSIFPFVR